MTDPVARDPKRKKNNADLTPREVVRPWATSQAWSEGAETAGAGAPEMVREMEVLVATLRKYRRNLLRTPGVTAVDIGYKLAEKEHRFLDQLALRVHVERKIHEDHFASRPRDRFIPENYPSPSGEPYQMDVIEADYKPFQATQLVRENLPVEKFDRRRRIDPLVGGISIGSPKAPAGTLGALVWDRFDGSICILSNWHILAGDLHVEVGNPCFQPGRFDQGRSTDVVAHLKRWQFDRQMDAAIAELNGSRRYCAGKIISLFQPIEETADPHLGMEVLKSGRTSTFTQGFIDGLFFSAAIEYSQGIVQVFEEQIHIAPLYEGDRISEAGDSGAIWVEKDSREGYRAVGLHFAGDLPRSAFGEYALANPMTVVAERLNISFRPLFFEVRDEDLNLLRESFQSGGGGQGVAPVRIALSGLTGSGGQPVGVDIGGGG